MNSLALFKRLLAFSVVYWRAFAVGILGMSVIAASETAFPALMKKLFDSGFYGDSLFPVWWVPLIIMMIFVVRGAASFLATYSMTWLANSVLRDIRALMFERLVTLPTPTFDTKSSGQLISKMISEAQMVLLVATSIVATMIKDGMILIGLIGWLIWLNWKLTLVVLFLMPALAIVIRKFSKRMRKVSRESLQATSRMTSSVEEAVSGNRLIKIYGGEDYEKKRFGKINNEVRQQAMRFAIASGLQTPISQFIAAFGVATVVTLALIQTRAGSATPGDFVSFITAMLLMFGPLKHLAEINSNLQKGLAAAEGIFTFIDEKSEIDTGRINQTTHVRGDIKFESINLQYQTRSTPALFSINLHLPAGKTYAFVGPSGSGKTSLINLLPRLYDPSAGRILIDDIDIKDLSLRSLRSLIALVSQDVVLFNDTIGKNIAYGRDDVTETQIIDAARVADLLKFIESLPTGLSTVVGDRGLRLSGGQRQRIAIARAVIKNAPILLLDEATSALDTQSELAIQKSLDHLRKGRTTLIVAHRLSTILKADQIFVMDHGSVIQAGTHDELVSVPGLYQKLSQQSHENKNNA